MLFHILRHIQTDQVIHTVKQVIGQLLDQLCFSHTGGADKNEGNRLLLGADAHPVPTDGPGYRIHSLILTNNMIFQAVRQALNLLILLCLDLGSRNLCPKLNDSGKILHGYRRGRQLFQLLNLPGQLHQLAAQNCQPLIVLVLRILVEHTKLQLIVIPFLLQLCQLGYLLTVQIHIRAGLIQQVDGLIRQETIGDIALRQHHTLMGNLRRNGDTVELSIGLGQTLHNLACLGDGGFCNSDRLEAALQGGILFNIFPIFRKCRSADNLYFSPGKGGFQDICRVHAALCIAGTHQIMNLINHQNDIAALLDLTDQALHAALKLTTELGTSHQSRQIQQKNLLVPELIGNISGGDSLGKTLRNGSFANARLADQTGVVFLAAVENLDDALGLHIPTNDSIQLSFFGSAGEIHAVAVQKLVFLVLLFLVFSRLFLFRLLSAGHGGHGHIVGGTAKQLVQQRKSCRLAVHIIVVRILSGGNLAKHTAHFITDEIQIILGNPHLFDCFVNLGNSQTPGALQAVALVHGYTVFHFGQKYHSNILFALGAHFRLHDSSLLYSGSIPLG